MTQTIVINKRCEIVLHSTKEYDNPFLDVDIDAVFTHENGKEITLPGFWNGENEWKVRFSPNEIGKWNYKITCSDKENTSLTDCGEIISVANENPQNDLEKHGFVRLEPGKQYFVYDDGTPFFYLADTHWMMPDYEHLHDCNFPGCNCGSQFKHLVQDRIKKGFNAYQTYFSSARTNVTHSGTESWWAEPFTRINPKPFNDTMDVMMDYLADNGLTIALGFGTHYTTIASYKEDAKPLLAFVRYSIARYACYPLIWITAQEITDYNHNAYSIWRQVGELVGQLDGYHRPNGAHMHVHAFSEDRSVALAKEPWHQWWTIQGGHGGVDRLKHRYFYRDYLLDPAKKPIMETENQYEDIYCSGFCGHDAPRMGAWRAILSGCSGFTYGVTGVWVLSYHYKDAPVLSNYSPEDWRSGMIKPGSAQVGYMKKFFEYVGWPNLVPEFGYKYGIFESRKDVAIAHRGNDTLVYYFYDYGNNTAGYFTDLKENTTYHAFWFDTITGKFVDLPDVTTEGDKLPIPKKPSERDWVYILTTEELGERDTEPYPVWVQPIPADEAKLGEKYEIKAYHVSAEDPEHPASNMFDGNPETYWQPYALLTNQTITVDLGESKDLGYVHFECCNKGIRWIRFRIFASNDGENFDLLSERTERQYATGGRFGHSFDPVSGKYRYVRFFVDSIRPGEAMFEPGLPPIDEPLHLSEFAVFAKAE